MKRLRLDLHSHTWYSHDSLLKPEHFVAACLAKGINCIAVTDHNEVDGAKAVARLAPFKVIVGEEIRTRDGEISGLFLKHRIPPNLSAEETIREIRRQKGLVYIPHPFAAGVVMRLKEPVLERVKVSASPLAPVGTVQAQAVPIPAPEAGANSKNAGLSRGRRRPCR